MKKDGTVCQACIDAGGAFDVLPPPDVFETDVSFGRYNCSGDWVTDDGKIVGIPLPVVEDV